MSIRTFAWFLLGSSLCGIVRSGMRGVRLGPQGVELRDISHFVVPRIHRYTWAMLEQVVLDQSTRIALDLWDGRRAFLPRVSNRQDLANALERVALARAIPVKGGGRLDSLVEPEELGLSAFSRRFPR